MLVVVLLITAVYLENIYSVVLFSPNDIHELSGCENSLDF